MQVGLDRSIGALSPQILFQIYFIIQLPLNLFLGTNYYLPRFVALSPLSSAADIVSIGSLCLAAQLVFVATIYVWVGRSLQQSPSISVWPRSRVNFVCAGIFVLAYCAYFYLVITNGGFAAFAEARELWRTAGVAGQGWILFPATTLPAIAMCAVLLNNRDQFNGGLGAGKIFLLYVLAAFPASQLGFRALVFLPLVQAGFFYHIFIRKIPGRYLASGSLTILLGFTIYGSLREVPYSVSYGNYLNYLEYIYINRPDVTYTALLRSMGADILQQVIDRMQTFQDYIMLVPSMVESATIFIPSTLWPDKPLPLSVQFSRDFFGIDGGVSPTIVGEGYWHGGLLGVFALMAFAGLLQVLFRYLLRNAPTDPSKALLMLSIYPSLFMMAESFQGYMNGIVLIAIAVWLVGRAAGFQRVPVAGGSATPGE